MSGAQSWSVKGIDPKVREAVREAAARQGMSLGEYLSQALQSHTGEAPAAPPTPGATPSLSGFTPSSAFARENPPTGSRTRSQRYTPPPSAYDEEEDDWGAPAAPLPRVTDPVRLAQRIESIERRTQLAVTGLDRAVSTIDRSVLGLAARIEDAEALSGESADRIADALEQFRIAGDTLGGRLHQAEQEVGASREALERANRDMVETRDRLSAQVTSAQTDLNAVRERLENQVNTAEEVARRAEAAANFLSTELENRDAALGHKFGALEDKTRDSISQALAHARASAEEAARQAAEASADAVLELRALQDRLADRLEESEHNARRAIETAVEQTRAEHERASEHTRTHHQHLAERIAGVEFEARGVKESLVEEVVRLESEIGNRIAASEQLKAEQQALISRIEKAEGGAREATAGLRQAAGAAIADLRNAQLGLAARLKQVEEAAGRAGALDLAEMRAQQAEIGERLASLEDKVSASPMQEALANFEKRLEDIQQRVEKPTEDVGGQVKTLDEALNRLAARLAETESSANTAIRTLEETVSGLGAKIEKAGAAEETEKLRAMVEQRLDHMAQQTQSEIATQIQQALGETNGEGLEGALLDVNRRLAAAERRQAQTIEAISIEIKRMSESVDKRLRTVENRNDDSAGATIREELSRMAHTLEARFDEIERREAAAFDRMGLEVGRLSERLEERVGAVESRSAQAIEHVGEQVARMAERFNHRHEALARDLGERMLDSEERAGARVADAIGSIMQRLSEVEEHSTEAVAPVQKAVSSVASRLQALETSKDEQHHDDHHIDDIPTPSRRFEDFGEYNRNVNTSPASPFGAHVSPMDAAQPTRAAPLPPITPAHPDTPSLVEPEHDIYFAEDIDEGGAPAPTTATATQTHETHTAPLTATPPLDLSIGDDDIVEDAFLDDVDAFAPPPPEDDDPFWTPDAAPIAPASSVTATQTTKAPETTAPASKNDYLNAARKAAQAQAAPAKGGKTRKETAPKTHEVAPTPTLSLRGSSRIVLWGTASAVALLIAGGAWYMKAQKQAHPSAPPPAQQPATPAAQETPTEAYDASAPFGQPATDPFEQQTATPADGTAQTATPPATTAAPTTAAPTSTPQHTTPPVAQTTRPQTTASAAAANAPVVAGPLPSRSVSLEQAARGGDPVAQYELALQRIAAGQPNQAVLLLHTAADHGLAMAQYRLAKLYERGDGVPADLTLARQWTERAAAAGNRRAMHDLGVYFARGEGASLDEAAAFRWFRQAAELGVADSQFNLGVLYQQGRGVAANPSEAEFWFLVAARQGDEDAAARAQALAGQLQPVQVNQARARAEAFRPRAASAIANGEFGPRPWTAPAATRTTTTARAQRPAT